MAVIVLHAQDADCDVVVIREYNSLLVNSGRGRTRGILILICHYRGRCEIGEEGCRAVEGEDKEASESRDGEGDKP